ncbi:MAG: tRNA (adenosine(37)-N6)-threonylcarbamoyltransferase complex dimerization subunit type 1 TsaB [Planctomycetes bacterium]|nr:tRNA (adenosine(37)-N6)-threonylcarbamoyltransferase complex dimerization subunit type 1 TsaB [Planctomycetota bacterium]
MKIIAIETSGIKGGVALMDCPIPTVPMKSGLIGRPRTTHKRGERGTATGRTTEYRFTKGMVHGRYLVPAIQKGLKELKWKTSDIDMIAVDIGPGSYTGLRVGVATAKTLVYTLNKLRHKKTVLTTVVSLDAMVKNIRQDYKFICPMIDARWNQVYSAIYKNTNGIYKRISDYLAIRPEELVKRLPPEVHIFGDGLTRPARPDDRSGGYKDIFKGKGITFGDEKTWYPRPKYIAQLGLEEFNRGKKTDPIKLVPLYLRLTEAEMKKKI